MKTEITKLKIENEMDIVLAHRRAMQVFKFSGASISDQTRFATAVSEISRNALEYCNGGAISFSIILVRENVYQMEAVISDCGPGIKDLDNILSRDLQTYVGKGRGIVFSKKLVDTLRIQTGPKGTSVSLIMNIPANGAPINNLIIQGWITYIQKQPAISAYEELKMRNAGLIELTEELKAEQEKTEIQFLEIKNLNEKLQKTNNYLEEFTYTVSHDLKTPLTTLNLSLQFLEDADDQESQLSYIGIISRAAKRLERTVQGLVEILEVQTKTYTLAKKINLEDFFDDIKDVFRVSIDTNVVSFSHSFLISEVCYIPSYLTSIFTNTISNSIKYRQPGIALKIDIRSRRKNGMAVITFSDNAEGIDLVKNSGMLFTPFTRFNHEQEGKGIGLYIIRKMIEKNGGRIEVESEPGRGTDFIFYLKEYQVI